MRRLALLALGLCGLAVALPLAGCGPKRPPALATAEGGKTTTSDSSTSRTPADTTLNTGPDVMPVDRAGTAGEDIPSSSDVTREGGPLEDIFYEFDQHTLTDAAKATLDRHAAWLKARPRVKVSVEGHCDERGTTEYNLALGDKRARAARDYLVGQGVPEGRLTAISLGKERPLDPGHGEAAWAKNRRAHFAVSR